MTTARPYLAASLQELLSTAKANWQRTDVLAVLLAETKHRKSKRASMLSRDLQKRIQLLKSGDASSSDSDADGIPSLKKRLQAYEARIRHLERELATMKGNGRSPIDSILAKWGLSSSCPPAVFEAAKRSWRKHLHPDAHSAKSAAERKVLEKMFQDFEEDLAKLAKMRWP